MEKLKKMSKGQKKDEHMEEYGVLEEVLEKLNNGVEPDESLIERFDAIDGPDILTTIPFIVVLNISDADLNGVKSVEIPNNLVGSLKIPVLLEEELMSLNTEERKELIKLYGYEKSVLEELWEKILTLLDLITYYTYENRIAQAWFVRRGSNVKDAVAIIHTDLSEKFIKAEIINLSVLLEAGSLESAKSRGLIEIKGKDYEVQHQDCIKVIHH